MSASVEALARVLAAGIAEVARDIAREEGRRAALEVLDRVGTGLPQREWVSQVEAGRVAGVTPQTIREWLRAGALGKPGRRGRVNAQALARYLSNAAAGDANASPTHAAKERILSAFHGGSRA